MAFGSFGVRFVTASEEIAKTNENSRKSFVNYDFISREVRGYSQNYAICRSLFNGCEARIVAACGRKGYSHCWGHIGNYYLRGIDTASP